MGKLGRRLRNAGLSCRRVSWNFRPCKPQKSERRLFQISLWLKLAVFRPICGAAGANNSPKPYDVRRDCSDPCSWTAKGSFSAAVSDDGTCRRQGIPGPVRECWPGCPGISGCKAFVEGFSRVRSKRTGWATRGTVRRSGKIVQNCHSQAQLYSIPPALCREIAATVNARIVTSP